MIGTIEMLATGMLAGSFFIAAVFFLRFWRESRDSFFLAFAASFAIKGFNALVVAFMDRPNQGSPWNYVVGFCSSLLILVAILHKNLKDR